MDVRLQCCCVYIFADQTQRGGADENIARLRQMISNTQFHQRIAEQHKFPAIEYPAHMDLGNATGRQRHFHVERASLGSIVKHSFAYAQRAFHGAQCHLTLIYLGCRISLP